MSNEAVKIEDLGIKPVRRTCLSNVTISKGDILVLSDANVVMSSKGDNQVAGVFGGIAAEDKISTDGKTNISAYMFGVYDCRVGAAALAGNSLMISGANILGIAKEGTTSSGGRIVGILEEDTTVDEVARVRLRGF